MKQIKELREDNFICWGEGSGGNLDQVGGQGKLWGGNIWAETEG